MKRTLLILWIGLLTAGLLNAAVVMPEEAQQIAKQFLSNRTNGKTCRVPAHPQLLLKATRLKDHSDEPAFYVYEYDEDGFVLVSADDRLRPVLGHIHHGVYSETDLPDNFVLWLNYLTERISKMPSETRAQSHETSNYTPVEPLLEKDKIRWGQNEPYNNNCPWKGGVQCPTGCVATAAAQVMRYWKYPTTGRGSHSYEWNNQTLSANFAAHTYDWNNMPGTYQEGVYTSTQAKAVARLMSDLGIAFEMEYDTEASGSNGYSAAKGLVDYFKYDSAIHMLRMDEVGAKVFEKTVANELKAGRPVMISGMSGGGDMGHEFVCDGVDDDDLFHINWGWDGWFNGDFAMTALYPEGTGTGGAPVGEGYTTELMAIVGIQPNQGNPPYHYMTIDSLVVANGKTSIGRNESFYVHVDTLQHTARGLFPWTGYLGALICDDDYNIVSEYSVLTTERLDLDPFFYYYYVNLPSNPVSASVANGTYKLVIAYTRSLSNRSWQAVYFPNNKIAEMEITVKSTKIEFAESEEEEEPASTTLQYISSLSATDWGEERMRFEWEAPTMATRYVVNVFTDSETDDLFSSDTVTSTAVTVPFYYPGEQTYSWTVQALSKRGKLLQKEQGKNFVMEVTTDYKPKDMEYYIRAKGIEFSWRGGAPMFRFELYRDDILQFKKILSDKEYYYSDKTPGSYEWRLCSMNQLGTIRVSKTMVEYFVVEDEGIEQAVSPKTADKYIQNGLLFIRKNESTYDALGR